MRKNNISTNLDLSMKKAIANLRLNPCADSFDSLFHLPGLNHIIDISRRDTGKNDHGISRIFVDVSAMLSLISAVREKCIERHLAAERALIPKCFAFGHINYSDFITYFV